jgi:hypothetical protein
MCHAPSRDANSSIADVPTTFNSKVRKAIFGTRRCAFKFNALESKKIASSYESPLVLSLLLYGSEATLGPRVRQLLPKKKPGVSRPPDLTVILVFFTWFFTPRGGIGRASSFTLWTDLHKDV